MNASLHVVATSRDCHFPCAEVEYGTAGDLCENGLTGHVRLPPVDTAPPANLEGRVRLKAGEKSVRHHSALGQCAKHIAVLHPVYLMHFFASISPPSKHVGDEGSGESGADRPMDTSGDRSQEGTG